jgi:hypothetical protein
MFPRLFIDVDPATLHLPSTRLSGADRIKLNRQLSQYGSSSVGMPSIEVYRGSDGKLLVYNGVTRATRIAKFAPGRLVRVEVMEELKRPVGRSPTVGDRLP